MDDLYKRTLALLVICVSSLVFSLIPISIFIHETGHVIGCLLSGGLIYEFVIKPEYGWVTCHYYKKPPYYLSLIYYLSGLVMEIVVASILYLVPYTRGIGGVYFGKIGFDYLFGNYLNDFKKAGLLALYTYPFRIYVLISFLTLSIISFISYFRFFEELE